MAVVTFWAKNNFSTDTTSGLCCSMISPSSSYMVARRRASSCFVGVLITPASIQRNTLLLASITPNPKIPVPGSMPIILMCLVYSLVLAQKSRHFLDQFDYFLFVFKKAVAQY